MPTTKAIIFDLDGTLLDTLADLADAMNAALKHFSFPQHAREYYKTAVGDGVHLLAERVLPANNRKPETIASLVAEMQKVYATCWQNKTKPYEGIPELLKELNLRNIRTAVLSNKPDAKTRICIEHFFTSGQFDLVMGASDKFPLKPDPAAVHHIIDTMQIPPESWLYLGDTNTDMQTAKRAGIRAIGVTWGFRDRHELIQNGADIIVDFPLDLIPLLETH